MSDRIVCSRLRRSYLRRVRAAIAPGIRGVVVGGVCASCGREVEEV